MKVILLFSLFFAACDFADDPIANVFKLSKKLIIVNEKINIDPSISSKDHFIYDKLFQKLDELAQITTTDSILWKVKLKKRYFTLSSNDLIETEDIYYSYQKNLNRMNSITGNNFNRSFKRFEKISDFEMIFEFNKAFDFIELAKSTSFYVYSKHNSSLDIPIGTGNYTIFLKPEKDEYVLMPFSKFIHTQKDSIEELYWLNTRKDEVLKRNYKFLFIDEKRISELRNYAVR